MSTRDIETIRREIRIAQRRRKIELAKTELLDYLQISMPAIEDPDNPELSAYSIQPIHQALANIYREVAERRLKRVLIIAPPRHGKTEEGLGFCAHYFAKHPAQSLIFGTYNQPFADEQGSKVRERMTSQVTRMVFPELRFKKGKMATDHLETDKGGNLYFAGRGGTVTGRGGHGLFIDDLLKNEEEARSDGERDAVWNFLQRDFFSRAMDKHAWTIMQGTRWHDDDPIGRITDPNNRHYKPEIAKLWTVIHLSAVARVYGAPEDDPLGRAPYECLWPARFDLEFFDERRLSDPTGFAKLYQGVPTASDGTYFTKECINLYKPAELPNNLQIYAGSDHAVGQKQEHDLTCLLIVGVDAYGHIWILDCVWKRMRTDETVNEMLKLMAKWTPVLWWAEDDHIGKSIGPFLFKRMAEEKIYINVVASKIGNKDLVQRSQPIQGRARMGMVHIPEYAPYRERAVNEMLKFDKGDHDDFISALSHIGQGLRYIISAPAAKGAGRIAKSGTIGWIKQQAARDKRRDEARAVQGSF